MEERKMVDYKAIGARVKYYRKKKQITQRELSAILGVTESYISGIENGSKISLIRLDQIADALGVHITFLISDELLCGDMKYYPQIMSIISNWPQQRIDFLKTVLYRASQILDDKQ